MSMSWWSAAARPDCAARRLREAAIDCLIVEARPRLGGRAWTVIDGSYGLDLGCGWLHSADLNPWVKIAQEQRPRSTSRGRHGRAGLWASAFRPPISKTFSRR